MKLRIDFVTNSSSSSFTMIAVDRSKFPGEGPIPGFLDTKEEVMQILQDNLECSLCECFNNKELCKIKDGQLCREFGIVKKECDNARETIANAMKALENNKIMFWMSSSEDNMSTSIDGETILDHYSPC